MSVEQNKANLHHFYEEFVDPGNPDVADEIIAPGCPLHFGGDFMGTGPRLSNERSG